MKNLIIALACTAIMACSGGQGGKNADGTAGKYVCSSCEYQSIELQADGQALLESDGVQMSATYSMVEGKVVIETETSTYIFALENGSLKGEGDLEGTYSKP